MGKVDTYIINLRKSKIKRKVHTLHTPAHIADQKKG